MGIDTAEFTEIRLEEPKAIIARKLFKQASVEHPARVQTQAATIAVRCHQYKLSPVELKIALLNDRESILNVLQAGKSAHESGGKKVEHFDADKVREIIQFDFDMASRYINLPPELFKRVEDGHANFMRGKRSRQDVSDFTLICATALE